MNYGSEANEDHVQFLPKKSQQTLPLESKHEIFSKLRFFFLADSNAAFINFKIRRELDTLRRTGKDLQLKCFKAAFPAHVTSSIRSSSVC